MVLPPCDAKAVNCAIVINLVVIAMGGYDVGERKAKVLNAIALVLSVIFAAEVAIKITVLGFRSYFRSRWVRVYGAEGTAPSARKPLARPCQGRGRRGAPRKRLETPKYGRYRTVWYSAVRYGTAHYGTVWCGLGKMLSPYPFPELTREIR